MQRAMVRMEIVGGRKRWDESVMYFMCLRNFVHTSSYCYVGLSSCALYILGNSIPSLMTVNTCSRKLFE